MQRRLILVVALLATLGHYAYVFGQEPTDKGKTLTKPVVSNPANLSQSRPEPGRFRVTLTGYTVNRKTSDNILETDGKGDEVFILTEVAQYDRHSQDSPGVPGAGIRLGSSDSLRGGGHVTLRRSLVSILMGDVNNQNNPPRIQAGSASGAGGLRTGDRFPTNEPWLLANEPTSERPPMILWEGDLRRGHDLVIIVPTIWEWDGGNAALRQQFTEDIDRYFSYATRTEGNRAYVWRGLTGVDLFGAGDRPVGMLVNGPWFPHALSLNFEVADYTATTSPNNMGLGVVMLPYIGRSEDYSLYLKVERR